MNTGRYQKCVRNVCIGMLLTIVIVVAVLFYHPIGTKLYSSLDTVIYLLTMLLLTILLNWFRKGNYSIGMEQGRIYAGLLFLDYCLALTGVIRAFLNSFEGQKASIYYCTIVAALISAGVLFLYGLYVQYYLKIPREKARRFQLFHCVYAICFGILLVTTPITGLMLRYDEGGTYYYPVNTTFTAVCIIVWVMILIAWILRYAEDRRTRGTLVGYFLIMFIVYLLYMIAQFSETPFWLPSLSTFGGFVGLLVIFCTLYVEHDRMVLSREHDLVRSELNNMQLQINPHFIYNTLGSIKSLCVSDPEKARDLTQDFADYLRNNYTDMTREPMVPFREEIHHLKQYLAMEQVRFPNLKIEYDLKAMNFRIPNLSVQPLAENAVQHGIGRRRYSEGTLQIISGEQEEAFFVVVKDNGVGFSEEAFQTGKMHIGIQNVRQRLTLLCGGTLTVESEPDIGTTCTIQIPKRNDEKGALE